MVKLELKNESKTLLLGAAIGRAIESLKHETIELHLKGNLGAGKTTLVRGILQYLNWKNEVTSPTYTLCEEYEIKGRLLLHVDLYRINSAEDVEILNLEILRIYEGCNNVANDTYSCSLLITFTLFFVQLKNNKYY